MVKDSLINVIVETEESNTKSILPSIAGKKMATVSLPVKLMKRDQVI